MRLLLHLRRPLPVPGPAMVETVAVELLREEGPHLLYVAPLGPDGLPAEPAVYVARRDIARSEELPPAQPADPEAA